MVTNGNSMRARWGIAIGVLALLGGSDWIAASAVAGQIPLFAATALRCAAAAVVLALTALVRRSRWPRGPELREDLLLSLAMLVAPVLLAAQGRRSVSSGLAAMLMATVPLLAAWMATRGPRPIRATRGAWLAMLVGPAGVGLMSAASVSGGLDQAAGAALVILAAACEAWALQYAWRKLNGDGLAARVAVQLGVAALLFAGLSWGFERGSPVFWTASTVGPLLAWGVVGTAIAAPLRYWLLRRFAPFQVGSVAWLAVVVAILEGGLLERGLPSFDTFAGLAMAAGALIAVLRAEPEDDESITLQTPGK